MQLSGILYVFHLKSPSRNVIAHVRYITILTWLQGSGTKLQMFHDFIFSQFPEETWAQRKPNQIYKNDQKASESC